MSDAENESALTHRPSTAEAVRLIRSVALGPVPGLQLPELTAPAAACPSPTGPAAPANRQPARTAPTSDQLRRTAPAARPNRPAGRRGRRAARDPRPGGRRGPPGGRRGRMRLSIGGYRRRCRLLDHATKLLPNQRDATGKVIRAAKSATIEMTNPISTAAADKNCGSNPNGRTAAQTNRFTGPTIFAYRMTQALYSSCFALRPASNGSACRSIRW